MYDSRRDKNVTVLPIFVTASAEDGGSRRASRGTSDASSGVRVRGVISRKLHALILEATDRLFGKRSGGNQVVGWPKPPETAADSPKSLLAFKPAFPG